MVHPSLCAWLATALWIIRRRDGVMIGKRCHVAHTRWTNVLAVYRLTPCERTAAFPGRRQNALYPRSHGKDAPAVHPRRDLPSTNGVHLPGKRPLPPLPVQHLPDRHQVPADVGVTLRQVRDLITRIQHRGVIPPAQGFADLG